MKKSMKLATVAACAVAMSAAMVGGTATSAFAQPSPAAQVPATITYGKTATVKATFTINDYDGVAAVKSTEVSYNKKKADRNVKATVKKVSVKESGKVTVTMSVKGINANYGKKNSTVVSPVVTIDGKKYTNLAPVKVTCKQAAQTITTKTVKKSVAKKKAVSVTLKSSSGNAVKVLKKVKTKELSAKKGSSKLVVSKHKCKKGTKSHTIKVKVKVKASKNYKALNGTTSVKVKMK